MADKRYAALNSLPIVTAMDNTWLEIAPGRGGTRTALMIDNFTGTSLTVRNAEQPTDVFTMADGDSISVEGQHAWEGKAASGSVQCIDNYD